MLETPGVGGCAHGRGQHPRKRVGVVVAKNELAKKYGVNGYWAVQV